MLSARPAGCRHLLAITNRRVGPDTAAQLLVTAGTNPHRVRNEASLAALCGVAPVPASSGKITRHRLSRGGDRAANNALYRIALVRMSAHQQTRDYVAHQHGNGRTKKEILRLLKRAIAREIFRLLTRPAPIDDRRAGDRAGNAAVAEPSTSRLCSGQARRLRACINHRPRGTRLHSFRRSTRDDRCLMTPAQSSVSAPSSERN